MLILKRNGTINAKNETMFLNNSKKIIDNTINFIDNLRYDIFISKLLTAGGL